MALRTSNTPYGETAIQSHCVRAFRRNDAALDYREDMRRIQMIYMARGYSKERIKQIAMKMRLNLLLKSGKERKAFQLVQKFGIKAKGQILLHKNTRAAVINGRLLGKLKSKRSAKEQSYVVTFEDTTKIHEMLKELVQSELDTEGVVAHKVFPGVLQEIFPKWAVSRMLDNYMQSK